MLHDFGPEGDYGAELRIVVVGYIRPEAPFTTLEALVDRIHLDGWVTEDVLQPRVSGEVRGKQRKGDERRKKCIVAALNVCP